MVLGKEVFIFDHNNKSKNIKRIINYLSSFKSQFIIIDEFLIQLH